MRYVGMSAMAKHEAKKGHGMPQLGGGLQLEKEGSERPRKTAISEQRLEGGQSEPGG